MFFDGFFKVNDEFNIVFVIVFIYNICSDNNNGILVIIYVNKIDNILFKLFESKYLI